MKKSKFKKLFTGLTLASSFVALVSTVSTVSMSVFQRIPEVEKQLTLLEKDDSRLVSLYQDIEKEGGFEKSSFSRELFKDTDLTSNQKSKAKNILSQVYKLTQTENWNWEDVSNLLKDNGISYQDNQKKGHLTLNHPEKASIPSRPPSISHYPIRDRYVYQSVWNIDWKKWSIMKKVIVDFAESLKFFIATSAVKSALSVITAVLGSPFFGFVSFATGIASVTTGIILHNKINDLLIKMARIENGSREPKKLARHYWEYRSILNDVYQETESNMYAAISAMPFSIFHASSMAGFQTRIQLHLGEIHKWFDYEAVLDFSSISARENKW
ncbi:hypothetical protein CJJ23_00105 [Mycoplasmopsis agassizii]|uniref:DUF4231 domain-containing protein n=1 Tax=Mycoplasmopsis agassizii TaxID=33922 RepID=A0A269TJR7_9BACT|nr:hypothetical protein [Mycoplasmopsis agassizii]PAK21733.1 hypothetical protein CJJ23_00105 [Mycoplasmopsis agassizii]